MTTLQHSAPTTTEPSAWAGLQVILLGVLEGTVGLGTAGWLAGIAYAVGTQALLSGAVQRSAQMSAQMSGRGVLGPADRVTSARGLLVGAVTALVADGSGETVLLVALAAVALALDFVDGQVARRTGTASAMGARYDMEVDAFLILVLSAHVALGVGPWVVVMGALRYAFVVASWSLVRLRGALPPSYARKVVAAVQGIALVVAASGLVPYPSVLVGLALAALVWSFGRDVVWLWRNAPESLEKLEKRPRRMGRSAG
ncbi:MULTISPECIES: CDP-alcohol phosphatidyltransferase family protein [Saccharothrix]|uniref:CDP-alcohol phosphatidyltransferase family protein n=1 Tax=Saccharothrix TaxID=2071 RepID=UPI0009405B3B|nr:CDP-alcohol phosphatidyltransferase family protein [Saccharothrix sp. CB00851]OKI33093.1 CDP-alcohol phosphatidyltransferase [Saccharothrix sp. CB00851]